MSFSVWISISSENPKIYSYRYQLEPSRFPFFAELAKSTLLENQGAEKIVKKLEVLEKSFDEKSDNKLELAACGSMLNVASDDGMVTVENSNVQFSLLIFIHFFYVVCENSLLHYWNLREQVLKEAS